MAGRALQHRLFKLGTLHPTDALGHIPWRTVVLIVLAVIAAAVTSYSVIVDPPATAPPDTSYLPSASSR